MVLPTTFAIFLALGGPAFAQGLESVSPAKGPFNDVPILGLGTYLLNLSPQNASGAIAGAIEIGYRHFDTAAIYGNQKLLAPGFKDGLSRTGLRREDIWVTSKLWNNRHGSQCEQGLKETLNELGLEYLDLYLMHFPIGNGQFFDHVETWKCMQTLVRPTGARTRFIGISNFNSTQLTELLASNPRIRPKVHQMELHPYLQQKDWVKTHQKENISVIGYAPLGNTSPSYQRTSRSSANGPPLLLNNPTITDIAKMRNCTSAQVVLAWNMRRGVAVIPKSSHLYRQKENFDAMNKCKLTDEDDAKVKGMESKWVARFNNPCSFMRMHCFEGLQADPVPKESGPKGILL